MQKIDFKKELIQLYNPSARQVEIVDVPKMNFLMYDGMGDPNTSPDFQVAVETLFGLAYTIKFMVKKSELDIDYGVLPLEGLWWHEDMRQFSVTDKSAWQWTLMIMQPDFIHPDFIQRGIEEFRYKKNPVGLDQIRFEAFEEGRSAQTMHIGPFSEEGPTVARVHQFITDNGFKNRGKHHEIYLSDIRKGEPSRWKTVIRQPMK